MAGGDESRAGEDALRKSVRAGPVQWTEDDRDQVDIRLQGIRTVIIESRVRLIDTVFIKTILNCSLGLTNK